MDLIRAVFALVWTVACFETVTAFLSQGIPGRQMCRYNRPNLDIGLTEEDDTVQYPKFLHSFVPDFSQCPGDFTYLIEFGQDENFHLNQTTGQLFLLNKLDRDAQAGWNRLPFFVTAICPTKYSREGCLSEITVIVHDINDNKPTFRRENDTVIATCQPTSGEEGRFLVRVTADDPDSQENGTVSYTMIQHGPSGLNPANRSFQVDSTTGVIRCTELYPGVTTGEIYNLEIVATDHGPTPLNSSTRLTVQIKEVFEPLFPEPIQHVMLAEDTRLNNIVTSFNVRRDVNGYPEFVLFKPRDRDYFAVGNYGILTLKRTVHLRSTRISLYNVSVGVMVTDGNVTLTDQLEVRITVFDVNDQAPVVMPGRDRISLAEGANVSSSLATFSATDADSGQNAQFDFAINNDIHNDFYINATGEVFLVGKLDREFSPIYQIRILAIDKGFPPLTGVATLVVNVTDVNDNTPEIQPRTINVFQNDVPGASVTSVEGNDRDTAVNGGPFNMSLPCNGQCPCGMNPSCGLFAFTFDEHAGSGGWGAGAVTIGPMFDFPEEGTILYLPIVVSDSGNPPMTGTSTLTIIVRGDTNDACFREVPGQMTRVSARKITQARDLASCIDSCRHERSFLCESFSYTPALGECLMAEQSPDTNRGFRMVALTSRHQTFGTKFSCYYGDYRNIARRQTWMIVFTFLTFGLLFLIMGIVLLSIKHYEDNSHVIPRKERAFRCPFL